ncbi:flagellar biosynthetic protein FliO [Porticoccus sp.]
MTLFLVMKRAWCAILLLPIPGISMAATAPSSAPNLFSASYVFQVIGSLLLVFGCIVGLLFLLKRVNSFSSVGASPLRVLGSARLGTREKVVLLQAGEQQLLVGVATGGVRTLHVFEQPVVLSEQQGTRDFSTLLGKALGQGKAP